MKASLLQDKTFYANTTPDRKAVIRYCEEVGAEHVIYREISVVGNLGFCHQHTCPRQFCLVSTFAAWAVRECNEEETTMTACHLRGLLGTEEAYTNDMVSRLCSISPEEQHNDIWSNTHCLVTRPIQYVNGKITMLENFKHKAKTPWAKKLNRLIKEREVSANG